MGRLVQRHPPALSDRAPATRGVRSSPLRSTPAQRTRRNQPLRSPSKPGRFRWVAERTFACLTRYRRLVRIYEGKPEHHKAMIWRGHRASDDSPPDPRTGRPTTSWPLERPATASGSVQSRPARQGAGALGRPAVASLGRGPEPL
ncbi:hypothetical protein E1267_42470 [Nonomuraea longispora]|uniref:Uncharacterized protein n=1 Tax=Nonomuraea longispora TaxID=1848320 RepID=A0A4R4MGP2_9ACTN|nr:hypothetical protein E1267_42470 [Nonomuraea longispora]